MSSRATPSDLPERGGGVRGVVLLPHSARHRPPIIMNRTDRLTRRPFRVDRMLSLSRSDPPPDRELIVRDAQSPPRDNGDPGHPEVIVALTYRGARLAEDLPNDAERVQLTGEDNWETRFRCPPSELDYWARTFFGLGPTPASPRPSNWLQRFAR